MQVVCGNCQLSFQAPDGATGLVCPICRSPLRAPDAPADADAASVHQVVEWNGGTLDDLVSLLSGPAWSARVEVLASGGGAAVGEVHVIAGGVSEAIHEGKSTHDALDKLRAIKNTRFRIEPRLPNPSDGDLTFPGPDQGKLEERPLAHLMRYCEDYVLTAGIEVWRGSENAKVEYRRGEIHGVTVGGIDAPERLAEVMKWSSGSYRLLVPRLNLPETAPKTAAPPAAVVAPRSAAAASKTIFGMPALDPAALAAATGKSVQAAQGQNKGPVAAPGLPRASSPGQPGPSARSGGIPAAAPTAPGSSAVSAAPAAAAPVPSPPAPAQSPAMARTIFGVQAPTVTPVPTAGGSAAEPTPATVVPAASAASGTPPPRAESPKDAPKPEVQKTEPAKPVAAAAPAESSKPARGAAAAASSRAATVPAAAAASSALAAEDKGGTKALTKPGETPVWTYVGVGFVFGLALLGVYRLVIVLAH